MAASQSQYQSRARAPEELLHVAKGTKAKPPSHSDFVLGLAVRRHMTGFALLGFDNLVPLQFGLIDVRKALETQQKAIEISAVLRELRKAAPEKLRDSSNDDGEEEGDDPIERPGGRPGGVGGGGWLVSFDDTTVDRTVPRNMQDSNTQQAIALLQGLVVADCKRLFKVAPALVHPRSSRKLLSVRGIGGGDERKQVYDAAKARVLDFPAFRHGRTGSLMDDTFLMSDAWAAARFAQRSALVSSLRTDAKLVENIRREILTLKPMIRLKDAAAEQYPRKVGKDLAEVLNMKVERQIDEHLFRLIEEEETRQVRGGGSTGKAGSRERHVGGRDG